MNLKKIAKDTYTKFIDVRTESEFKSGHISGAINIPLDQIAQRQREIKDLGNCAVILYCRSGNRSGMAAAYLAQSGMKNIHNGGGLEDVRAMVNGEW